MYNIICIGKINIAKQAEQFYSNFVMYAVPFVVLVTEVAVWLGVLVSAEKTPNKHKKYCTKNF